MSANDQAPITNAAGPAVLAGDLHWDLRQPCGDCPFLKTSPYHEGVEGHVSEYAAALQNNEFGHSCHKTDNRANCDGPIRGQRLPAPIQHCAGALLMILKTGRCFDLQLPLLKAMEAGKISAEAVREMTRKAKADKRVFTVPGLLKFYAKGMVEA